MTSSKAAWDRYNHSEKGYAARLRYSVSKKGKRSRVVNYLIYRQRAFYIIAARWGDDEPRCRYDTLAKNHPLRTYPCYGKLEIDHMNGGGSAECRYRGPGRFTTGGKNFLQAIFTGERQLDDLRLLCQLHQLWNR